MIIPVILSGGSGTRLWPLSRELYPKQLLRLTDDHTMLQNTQLRLADVDGMAAPIVICNEKHRFIVRKQFFDIGVKPAGIFLEPMGRNTAPAVAIAALEAVSVDPDALILVLPADHLIGDIPDFHKTLQIASRYANQGHLITFGIIPDRPETGYGYIRKGEPADDPDASVSQKTQRAFAIRKFVEKPDHKIAQQYLSSGDYCWNSGMFMFKATLVLDELKKYVPEILTACEAAYNKGTTDQDFFYLDKDSFEQCPADSIDYAIMENTDRGVMVSFNAGWDDLGSWEALWNVGVKDDSGNVTDGDVICVDVENTLVNARSRLVAVLGVRDLAVVETPDAILVASLQNTQGVKKIVDLLNAENRSETKAHCKRFTSWGIIETVDGGKSFQIRKITVFAKTSFSFSGHSSQSVHWTILDGTATLTMGDETTVLSKKLSIAIESGMSITLDNNDNHPLIFLEVAFGDINKTDHFDILSEP